MSTRGVSSPIEPRRLQLLCLSLVFKVVCGGFCIALLTP
ncbi:TPA: DUF3265 domain-containing protein [Aeromonas dhakensis]|nr:DUF3265 domain-containing protein [Aeromonas dhakensis]